MKQFFRGVKEKIKRFNWGNILLILISTIIGFIIFSRIIINKITFENASTLTSNILTINGIFSAILITYLFTRITWTKDRKLETYNEAISYSQKITEFRRILKILIQYYNVWESDEKTKGLMDQSKYKHIDFYDFRLSSISDFKPDNYELIEQLRKEEKYSEGQSVLYLAMASLVKQRKFDYYWQEELYKDYEHKGVYDFKIVEKWLECNIMDSITYWLSDNYIMIKFYALKSHFDEIKSAAGRINKKYLNYEVDNKLIRELAEDMSSYYLKQLYSSLKFLRTGIESLNFLIITLITVSLIFGILVPLVYLLLISENTFYPTVISIIAAINASLISYFIIKFPFMISRELKWT